MEIHLARANRATQYGDFRMGRLCIDISDDLERKFRIKVIERLGGKKGDLSRAVEEAIRKWIVNGD